MKPQICIFLFCEVFLSTLHAAELPWKHRASLKEKEAIAILQKSFGSAQKDADGNVTSLFILGDKEMALASIDFGMFTHLKSISINCHKKRTVSLLPYLKLTSKLWSLCINNAEVDENQLSHFLIKQERIYFLLLSDVNITDQTLRTIRKAEGLHSLILDGTNISDEGLEHLEDLQDLFSLDVSNTNISDKGVVSIIKISNLESLNLNNTRITDKSILRLAELNGLTKLSIRKTSITEEGRRKLREMRPDMKLIEY